jgi:hypothetical protein
VAPWREAQGDATLSKARAADASGVLSGTPDRSLKRTRGPLAKPGFNDFAAGREFRGQ